MKKGMKILAVVAVVVAVVVLWWRYEFPSATWRYKITVEIETPEGIKTGSAVREVSVSYGPTIGDIPTTSVKVKGEAVVVDLEKRGVLFGLLGNQYAYDLMFQAFPYHKGGLTREGIRYYDQLKDAKASLLEKKYLPRFVTFKELKDPISVKEVDRNNFEPAFGEGIRLKDVSVEITNEPVTWQVINYLPWVRHIKSNIDGTLVTTSGVLSNRLDVGQFQTGAGK